MMLHEPPDSHHYQAAQGWLELGNHLEANEELERISPLNRAHPDVLELRWKVYEQAKRWEVCAELAEAMKLKSPDDPRGSIYLAQTRYGQKQYQAAYDVLEPQVCVSQLIGGFGMIWPVTHACWANMRRRESV